MLKGIMFAVGILAGSISTAAEPGICKDVSRKADKNQTFFSPAVSHRVIGEGRLYFHTAPHEDCRSKDVFVISGDVLTTSTEFNGWYSVYYVNPKTGKEYDGWVRPERLKLSGTMGPAN